MTELSRDDPVREVIDSLDQVGSTTADRLQADGLETVGDVARATPDDLMALDGVGERRAERVHAAAEDIVGVVPRDVDFDATESVVSEAAIPLSVRRGEAVLTKTSAKGSVDIYHTRACPHVEANDLTERDAEWAERRSLDECQDCANPEARAETASSDTGTSPLVDSREVALEATLGEKLSLTMADRDGYACAWAIIDTEEPTTWETPTGDTWQTRRLRISQKMNGEEHYSECDLVVAADEIRLEDPPVKRRSAQPDAPSWGVETVGAVGRVSTTSLIQLQTDDEETDTKPEGDDTWRQYQNRGETA